MNAKDIKIGIEVAVPVNSGSYQYRVGRVARIADSKVKLVGSVFEWPASDCCPVTPPPPEETLQFLGIQELGPLVDVRHIPAYMQWVTDISMLMKGPWKQPHANPTLRWSIGRSNEPTYKLGDWFMDKTLGVCLTFTAKNTLNLVYLPKGRIWNDGVHLGIGESTMFTLDELRTLFDIPDLRPAIKAEVQDIFAEIICDRFGDEE